jgi:hypothetical protein
VTWPPNPSYDNPIILFTSDNSGPSYFSFGAKDGSKSRDHFANKRTIDYDKISKVVMTVENANEPSLLSLEFYDMNGTKEGATLGVFNPNDRKIEINLDLGERIIGIKKSDKHD